jgi:TPP-dependent 2-oxoacid decarboxylase
MCLHVANNTYCCYAGGPNSNDYGANHIIHHTIGLPDLGQQQRAFKEFTCAAVVVQHLGEAHHQIDFAISEALVGVGVYGGYNSGSTGF